MQQIIELIKSNQDYLNILIGVLVFLFFIIFRNGLSKGILSILAKVIFFKAPQHKDGFKASLKKPLSIYLVIIGTFIAVYLNYNKPFVIDTFKILSILIISWGVISYISDNLYEFLTSKEVDAKVNGVAIKFVSNLLKILTICFAIVMVISELGYNINGLITGLGVGGLAISLAAQDAIKNLISGFILMFDKPFDVGDLITTADITGKVENVTMRSTKIRKLDDSVVTVPNSMLSEAAIINQARINERLVNFKFGLVYATPVDVITKCENEIKDYLTKNELVNNSTIRVSFVEFNDSALTIEVKCFIKDTNLDTYFNFLELLNFEIKNIVEQNNTDFAFPTTTVHIEK